jgi:hypothetical protein
MPGIGAFVQKTRERFGGGQWLKNWKDDKEKTVWLHTAVTPLSYYAHQFNMIDVQEDKDNRGGPPKRFMRFLRFVSPDPETITGQQHFRDKSSGILRVLPDRDPFLLLREWLRRADHIGLEDSIFMWKNPKDSSVESWSRGELSGLTKRGRQNFGHSLDAKQEYIFVVVDHEDIGSGVMLTRESGLLGRKMGEVIAQQLKMLGEEAGDPLLRPYPFRWEYDKRAASPMNAYSVYKAEGLECTDEIFALITSEEYPDPVRHTVPQDGDMEKIRAAFEAAAQVELPLDEIFSEDQNVRMALCTGERPKIRPAASPGQAQRSTVATPTTRAVQRPSNGTAPVVAKPNGNAPAAGPATRAVQRPGTSAPQAASAPAGSQTRRKRVDPPAPPLQPEVEMIPCDDCKTPMAVTATECPKCGAKYEVDAEPEPQAVAPQASVPAAPAASVTDDVCFSCSGPVEAGTCTTCGLEQGDEIPF